MIGQEHAVSINTNIRCIMLCMRLPNDLTGQRFNKLVAVRITGKRKNGLALWLCDCDCGEVTTVESAALRSGKIQSCGCLQLAAASTHGMSYSPEYRCWSGMRVRCENIQAKGYAAYGGRGIEVCARWKDAFENFLEDMGPKPTKSHTIDRIDNDKGYSPDNCKWATKSEQANNRRSNINITAFGKTHTVAEWAELSGIHRMTIYQRLDAGWDWAIAVSKPTRVKASS